MKAKRPWVWFLSVLFAFASVSFTGTAKALTTNGWIASGSGKWETSINWSAGTPALSDAVNIVSGGSTIPSTAIIDGTTSGTVPGSMTISNLIVRRYGGIGAMKPPGIVSLTNAGTVTPLHILNSLTISIGGTVSITNSVLRMDPVHGAGALTDDGNIFINTGTLNEGSSVGANSAFYIGSQSGTSGALWLNAGQLVVTNTVFFDGIFFNYGENDMYVGYSGTGQMTVSNGTCYANQLYVAVSSPGTLTVAGGSLIFPVNDPGFGFPSVLSVGTGTVWVTGGLLDLVGDGQLLVGNGANGQMIVTNGNCVAGSIYVGSFPGARGTLTVAGGNIQPQVEFALGIDSNTVGTAWVTGGLLGLMDGDVTIGSQGAGQLTVSNGTWQAGDVFLCGAAGGQGTLTVAGGTSLISSNMWVSYALGTTGTIWVTGGQLILTNAAGTAGIVLGSGGIGQMTVSNGTFTTQRFSAGNFRQGTLTIAGGTNSVSGGALNVSSYPGVTGAVAFVGGQLVTTNADVNVGYLGVGVMTMSDGTWLARNALVGLSDQFGENGTGTVTIAGGTATFSSAFNIGVSNNTAGTVWLTGGQLVTTNLSAQIGVNGVAQMTVSNGNWQAGGVSVTRGVLTVAGGTTTLSGSLGISNSSGVTGTIWMTGGTLTLTNGFLSVGGSGVGQMTMSNGTLSAAATVVGFGNFSQGTLTFAGGTNTFSSLSIGNTLTTIATGVVWVTGGQLVVTNGITYVGRAGTGQMTVSNGTVLAGDVEVAPSGATQGTLTFAGGTTTLTGPLNIGSGSFSSSATVWLTGGSLVATNHTITVGLSAIAIANQMMVTNGTLLAGSMVIAAPNAKGTLTASGGTVMITSNLTVGDCDNFASGTFHIAGANVFVTNAAHNAVLDIRSVLQFDSGTLTIDRLVITNACGQFYRTGGTLNVTTVVLDPNFDADGDGLPNGWEIAHGLDPLSSIGNDGADGDPDNDGLTNLEEYQLGTDPLDRSSPYHITAIQREGSDVRATWMTVDGKTNVLQSSPGTTNGSYSNNFTDLSPQIIVPGCFCVAMTNYLDIGGATNTPSRYYRVRVLVP